MFLISFDDIIKEPKVYVDDILEHGFEDIHDGDKTFKNIQPRDHNDEFALFAMSLFPNHTVNWNFVRKSPLNQEEPNFIHKDNMMGDVTCILYLNEEPPEEDGTTIYDWLDKPICVAYSKFNRMVAFNAEASHSRNIFENFGEGDKARLVQVVFLKAN
jgi:hypothetical protein